MNLWILHYSFINHHFHHSTITIKQKIIINKLVTELHVLWGHFLWKIAVRMKNVKFRCIPRKKDEFRGKNPRIKFRGKKPNSAARLEIPRLRGNCGSSHLPKKFEIFPFHPNKILTTFFSHFLRFWCVSAQTLQVQLHNLLFFIIHFQNFTLFTIFLRFSTVPVQNLQLQLRNSHFAIANSILQLHKLSSVARLNMPCVGLL